ncbi:DNase I-like protein [Dioscorea alata]|uniref:DNase I-like protein n=1 Tax=Dioscorea alata TaxID=55571 RepID=A0ACB7VKG1_DIOAL|nr:DNase I-like protein [Dioscorea alata]
MNILAWNVRGLSRPAQWFLVRDFLMLYYAEVCYLQESKLVDLPHAIWRELGGPKLDCFAFVPARGLARGIVIGWNGSLFILKVVFFRQFCLSVEFICKRDNFRWPCTSVYGPKARFLKHAFWGEIRSSGCWTFLVSFAEILMPFSLSLTNYQVPPAWRMFGMPITL